MKRLICENLRNLWINQSFVCGQSPTLERVGHPPLSNGRHGGRPLRAAETADETAAAGLKVMSGTHMANGVDIPENARCRDCGYSLRALTITRCPECGRAFDPSNAATMCMSRRALTPWTRWFLKPPSLWFSLALGAIGLVWLYAFSVPEQYFDACILAYCLSLAGAGLWAALLITVLIVLAVYRPNGYVNARVVRRWLIVPLLALGVYLAILADVPLRIRLQLSRPWLDELVRLAETDPDSVPDSGWIGFFDVEAISLDGYGRLRLWIRDSGFLSTGGIQHWPASMRPYDADRYKPLGGGWHTDCSWLLW
ncbi:MAG: hypothetical protein JXO22_15510 [Phycisphaerae bacterium]|nr:hypothetical protein [Phycisphaerae bacterium]